jgi:hypothetical protein
MTDPDPRSAAEKLEAQLEARVQRMERERQEERQRELERKRREREAESEKARRLAEARAKAEARAVEQEVLRATSFPRRLLRLVKVANVVLAALYAIVVIGTAIEASSAPIVLPEGTGVRLFLATALRVVFVAFGAAVLHLVLTGIGALLDIRDDVADATEARER